MPLHFINPSTEQLLISGTLIKFQVIYLNKISGMNQNTKLDPLMHMICYISRRNCCNSAKPESKSKFRKKLRKLDKLDNKIMTEKSYVGTSGD